jgi:hypothetical protein
MRQIGRTAVVCLVSAATLAAGCGGGHGGPSAPTSLGGSSATTAPGAGPALSLTGTAPTPPTPWPSAADYTTIKVAVSVRDRALFQRTDWRTKSLSASLALRTLMTVRMAPGRCAAFVTFLYGNLLDLQEAYPGEDWRPLIRLVRRHPTLESSCTQRADRPPPQEGAPVLPGRRFGQLVA